MPRLIIGNDVDGYPYPTVEAEPWERRAACKDTDPHMWDSSSAESARHALKICAACPVLVQCRKQNLDLEYGIVGGLTERQRRRLRKGDQECVVCGSPASSGDRCPDHRECVEDGCGAFAMLGRRRCVPCYSRHHEVLRKARRATVRCDADGCGGPHYAKGLCKRHYQVERRRAEAAL